MSELGFCPLADPKLAGDLALQHVPLEAASALLVFPAVYVAWADGEVSARETKAVWGAARAAQLTNERALGLVNHWLHEKPKNLEALLDLTWRIYECVPALHQRCTPDLAFSMAKITARYKSGLFGLFRVGKQEGEALSRIEAYFEGRGLETERRKALTWGGELEAQLPGLTLTHHDQLLEAEGQQLSGPLERALSTIESAPHMHRFATWGEMLSDEELAKLRKVGVKERKKRLLPPVREGFAQLNDEERALIGSPSSLPELTPWQACRLALLLVCRSARGYADSQSYEDLLAAYESKDEEQVRAALEAQRKEVQDLLVHDLTPSPKLLHALLEPDQLEIVCRHYVRLVCAAYQGLKRTAPGLSHSYMIPLHGVYDLRVRQGHAWCLFVDVKRGVACALDPTAADASWDAGVSDSFLNQPLSAFNYANLSGLLARLLSAKSSLAAEAARELAPELGPQAAARLLIQSGVTSALEEAELEQLLAAAEREGAPRAYVERVLERHSPIQPEFYDAEWHLRTRRNLAAFLARSGLVSAGELGGFA